ncbi:MAG: hypothetical protein FWE03_00850 [Firmicutes bacterium]|nr:hypothetical protein [Bacillota bacterium]
MKKKLISIIIAITMTAVTATMLTGCNIGLPPVDPAFNNYQFMSIEAAYSKGFLDREDIKQIAYRGDGTVIEFTGEDANTVRNGWCCCLDPEEWVNIRVIEFTPSRIREPISSEVAAAARNISARNIHNHTWRQDGYSLRDIYNNLIVTGSTYNGVHLIVVTSHLWDYPAVIVDTVISGIVWTHGYPTASVFVFIPTDEATVRHSSADFRVATSGDSLRRNNEIVITIEVTSHQDFEIELTSDAWRGAAGAIGWRLYNNGNVAPLFLTATDDWAEVQIKKGDTFIRVINLSASYFDACCCEPSNLIGNFTIQVTLFGRELEPVGWLCTSLALNIDLR